MRFWRVLIANHLDPLKIGPEACAPLFQQIVQHREELLLGGIPRLGEVVVERHLVDGFHCRVDIAVCGKQHPFRFGVEFTHLF